MSKYLELFIGEILGEKEISGEVVSGGLREMSIGSIYIVSD